MKLKAPLILASQSPRRQELMREVGLEFKVVTRPVEEHIPHGMEPRAVAISIAEDKARAYHDLSPNNVILAADTIVAMDHQILGKPKDEADAMGMILRLSGRSHRVITGVSLFHKGTLRSFAEETKVFFRRLSKQEIRYYVQEYNPYDKAGAYGIQDWIGKIGVTKIEGDYYNVMGLPVGKVYQELMAFKA